MICGDNNVMELRKINIQDAIAQWEYTTALPVDENGLTNQYNGVSYEDYIETVLPTLISYEHPVNMPNWFGSRNILLFVGPRLSNRRIQNKTLFNGNASGRSWTYRLQHQKR